MTGKNFTWTVQMELLSRCWFLRNSNKWLYVLSIKYNISGLEIPEIKNTKRVSLLNMDKYQLATFTDFFEAFFQIKIGNKWRHYVKTENSFSLLLGDSHSHIGFPYFFRWILNTLLEKEKIFYMPVQTWKIGLGSK